MDLPDAGHRALRRGRRSIPDTFYMITACTHARHPTLQAWAPARLVVTAMRELDDAQWVTSQGYVIMPDHLHWLIQLGTTQDLPAIVQRLKGRTARSINTHLGRRGPVWQSGYHDRAIRGEKALRQAARYMVANPLRAGLVTEIGQYPHWDVKWL